MIENQNFEEQERIAKLKAKDVINQRGLTSYMNNTKWRNLVEAMNTKMPFKPFYDIKYLLEERDEESYYSFEGIINYTGDWGDGCYYFKTDAEFFHIEWIRIHPILHVYNRQNLSYDVIDACDELEYFLNKYKIHYEIEKNNTYLIYGYKAG